jgi:hypothetical protein
MPDQTAKLLKIACLILAALVIYRLARDLSQANPLAHVVIPALPGLAAEKNASAPAGGAATNSVKSVSNGTNKPGDIARTNSPPLNSTNGNASNLIVATQAPTVKTNSATNGKDSTNSADLVNGSRGASTNVAGETNAGAPVDESLTNAPSGGTSRRQAESSATNQAAGTNAMPPPIVAGANDSISKTNAGTNADPVAKSRLKGTNSNMRAGPVMARMGSNPPGMPLPELPPEIKARVDRIYESEILAPAVRPLPMGLIGIAGDVAFLRAASGQTGLIKEGDALGDLKLLRIGTNRVLIEQGGQKKELMIFEGYGGQSLLPEKGKNQNENTHD